MSPEQEKNLDKENGEYICHQTRIQWTFGTTLLSRVHQCSSLRGLRGGSMSLVWVTFLADQYIRLLHC